jgi:N-acetyl-1-D-myo-inositol-2-amino-2-deoxy-alpha-D-glucopyranoside deacetylase
MSSSQVIERVLFVHAHPDDETLATGGTIALLVDRGSAVTVITCTRGERGEVISDDLVHLRANPEALAVHRQTELVAAMEVLGVTDHRYLGEADARWPGRDPRTYTDSGMRWGTTATDERTPMPLEELDPCSLAAAELGEVAADIAAVISAVQPHVVVSYDENGGYGHPDHIRVHEATRIACEVLNVPFFEIVDDVKWQKLVVVDVAAALDRKRSALDAYRSQLTVVGEEFITPGGARAPITAIERFRRYRAPSSAFDESGWPTRVATCILAAFLGIVIGAVFTVVVGSAAVNGGVPWGAIAGVVVALALVAGLRLVFESRLVAIIAAIGMIGSAALVALATSVSPALNDSVLVLATVGLLIVAFAVVPLRFGRARRGKVLDLRQVKGSDLP